MGTRRRWFDGPFETKRDALRSSPVLASHRQTVDAGEWITDWARTRSEQLRSRDRYSSAKIVERHVRLHLAPQLSGIKLGELRPSHVSAIAEALNSTGRIHRAGAALGAGAASRDPISVHRSSRPDALAQDDSEHPVDAVVCDEDRRQRRSASLESGT